MARGGCERPSQRDAAPRGEDRRGQCEKQLASSVGENAIATTREQVSAIGATENQSAVQRLEQQRQYWSQLLAGSKLTADQRIEVQRSYNDTVAALNRARTSEQNAIARSDADAEIAISRLKLESQKQILGQEATAHLITTQQEFDQLRQVAQQEEQLDEQQLQARKAMLIEGTAEYENVYNQIRELRAKLNADLAQMDRQQQIAAANEAKQEVSTWKSAINEIGGAESGLVHSMISGQQTMSQSMLQIAGQFVEREIANDLKYYTYRLLLGKSDAATQTALKSAGLLVHLTTESEKTASTVTSQSAQTAAVVSGEASRTAAHAAGAAAGHAISAAAGGSQVMADAGKAFSGTMAALSGIPIIGPVIAPIAAAAAFALVAGYELIASSAGGDWDVAGTRLNIVHPHETIVPANIANPMRDFFEAGITAPRLAMSSANFEPAIGSGALQGVAGGGAGEVHIHGPLVQAIDTQTGAEFLMDHMRTIGKGLAAQLRLGDATLRGAGRPA